MLTSGVFRRLRSNDPAVDYRGVDLEWERDAGGAGSEPRRSAAGQAHGDDQGVRAGWRGKHEDVLLLRCVFVAFLRDRLPLDVYLLACTPLALTA